MFDDMTPKEVEELLKILEEEKLIQNKYLVNKKESLFTKIKRKLFKKAL